MTDPLETVLAEPSLRAVLKLAQWTPEQTAVVTQAQLRSGLSVADFCQRAGVKVWRLYKWRRQRKPHRADPAPAEADCASEPIPPLPPSFLPLQLRPAASPEPSAAPCAELLHPSGLRLRLWPQAPQALVLTLYQALVPPC